MSLKGTRTEQNLISAFRDEAVARSNYAIYASVARSEGFEAAARFLEVTANNEYEHSKLWLRILKNGKFPATEVNVKNAIEYEKNEWQNLYSRYAKEAKEEGFDHIAGLFEKVAEIEKHHHAVMERLLLMLNENQVMPDENANFAYMCSECGCIITQKDRPDYCPLCHEPTVFFFKINNKGKN